ncbi:MAG: O-antigen ligase family protein [Candidatus Peregrinibacteria bacterium]
MKNRKTYLLLLVFLVVFIINPFGKSIFELPKIHFLSISLSVIAIWRIVRFFKKREFSVRYSVPVLILLGFFLLSLVISTVFSIAPSLSFWGSYIRIQGLYSYLIYVIFFLIFINFLKTEKEQEATLKVLVLLSAVTAVHAVLEHFGILAFSTQALIDQEFYGRSFSTLGQPNYLGQFLIFPIWGGVYFVLKEKKFRQKLTYAAVTSLLLVGLMLTQNRASILGIIIGAVFLILLVSKIKSIYKYLISGGLMAAFAGFIVFFAPTMRSLLSRLYIWKGSLAAFTEHPIIGSGLETFQIVFQKTSPEKLLTLEKTYSVADRAHNQFLDILVTQGALGLAIFLAVLAGIFYLIFRNKKELKSDKILLISACALISTIISNFFSFPVTVHYLVFVLLVAIILSRTVKFKIITMKINIISVFISGMLAVFSFLNIYNSAKLVYADTLLARGIKHVQFGQVEEGVNEIFSSARLNPNQAETFYELSAILVEISRASSNSEILEKADEMVEYGGEFTNFDFRYYYFKGKIAAAAGNYTEAESLFKKANELAPTNPAIIDELNKF